MDNPMKARFSNAELEAIYRNPEKENDVIDFLLRQIPHTTQHVFVNSQNMDSSEQPDSNVLLASNVCDPSAAYGFNHHIYRYSVHGLVDGQAINSVPYDGLSVPSHRSPNGGDNTFARLPEMANWDTVEQSGLLERLQNLQIESHGIPETDGRNTFLYPCNDDNTLPDISLNLEQNFSTHAISDHPGAFPHYSNGLYANFSGNVDAISMCRDYVSKEFKEPGVLFPIDRLIPSKNSMKSEIDGINFDRNVWFRNRGYSYSGAAALCQNFNVTPQHTYTGRSVKLAEVVPHENPLIQGKEEHFGNDGFHLSDGTRRNMNGIGGCVNNLCGLVSPGPQPLAFLSDYQIDSENFVYCIAKDQQGCCYLQKKLQIGMPEEKDAIFNGILTYLIRLIVDPFGNYLVQKLLEICTERQRTKMIHVLVRDQYQLNRISLNVHGTRVVQKLIETLKTRQQAMLVVSSLQLGFLELTKDLNGNHVIQRCLQCLSPEDNRFFFYAAAQYCVEISTHQHGCVVMQRCIDYSFGRNQAELVKEICKNALLLAQDNFGNYVVQYILEQCEPSSTRILKLLFEGKYVDLSMRKFSSNVVEKCIKYFGANYRARIIAELISVPRFEQLLSDRYANYVIKFALENTEGVLHKALVEAILPHAKTHKANPHCKKIFSMVLPRK